MAELTPPAYPPLRRSARAILVNPRDEVLLAELSFPDIVDPVHPNATSLWITPGGGLHEHESFEAALIREVREETGMLLGAVTAAVAIRQARFFHRGEPFVSEEHYFFARVAGDAIDASEMLDDERQAFRGFRWFSVAALREHAATVRPTGLITLRPANARWGHTARAGRTGVKAITEAAIAAPRADSRGSRDPAAPDRETSARRGAALETRPVCRPDTGRWGRTRIVARRLDVELNEGEMVDQADADTRRHHASISASEPDADNIMPSRTPPRTNTVSPAPVLNSRPVRLPRTVSGSASVFAIVSVGASSPIDASTAVRRKEPFERCDAPLRVDKHHAGANRRGQTTEVGHTDEMQALGWERGAIHERGLEGHAPPIIAWS